MKPDARIMELCDRLTSPEAIKDKLSASELHELVDFIHECNDDKPVGAITGPGHTPNTALPPLGDEPRKVMFVKISVDANFEKRMDNQWMVEREIHADRWCWDWVDPSTIQS